MSIIKNFSISRIESKIEENVKSVVPVNHIIVVDVSGSMYSDLALIRKQLKNKLPNLVKSNDTISIIWFSGKNDAGILKEEVEIQSLKSLQELNSAIDKWLQPFGLTAFAKPLELASEMITRIKSNRPETAFSMIFLTDGYNNDCSWKDVEKSLTELEKELSSSTYVEYGYYADSKAISKMSEITGGESIVADHFDDYDNIFEKKITNSLTSFKKKIVEINNSIYNFAYYISDNNEINILSIKDGKVSVPTSVSEIYYFSQNDNCKIDDKALYAAAYILLDKTLSEQAEDILAHLGDKYIFNKFVNAYGKQKLNEVKNIIKECVCDESIRYREGHSSNLVIEDDAYCVMDLINDLLEGDNYFYPLHSEFNYKRIGKKRIIKNSLTEKNKEELLKIDNVNDLKEYVESLNNDLKFEYKDINKAHPLKNLVWNSERANLSLQVRYEGYVKLPKNDFNIGVVDTFQYRNYTLIKDGILNVSRIPVLLDEQTSNKLKNYITTIDNTQILDFSNLPIINRKMVKNVSAYELAEKEYELLKLKGETKVYNFYEKTLFERESEDFISKYGKEAETYLKELGITSFNGFAPKTESEESEDFYMSVHLKTKLKGLSSLPTVESVSEKINSKKDLKISEQMLEYGIKNYNSQTESEIYKTQSESVQKTILEKWLNTSKVNVRNKNRQLMCDIAKIKFALILSKKWFNEFESFEQNTLEYNIDNQKVQVTFDLEEKKEKL